MSEKIHNLLKIENYKTTIFTNKELKMIDDYINELEAYKYNMDRDYLRLEEENKRLYKTIEELSQYDREEEDMMNKEDYLEEENKKYKNIQKEFINSLNSYIELLSNKPDYIEERQKYILEEILSKYKESGE